MDAVVLQSFLEAIEFKITDASEYCWHCYGDVPHILEHYNDRSDVSCSAIFDRKTQEVYEIDLCADEQAFRWIHPEYRAKYEAEAKSKGVDATAAWGDVMYQDLELADILSRIRQHVGDSTRGE